MPPPLLLIRSRHITYTQPSYHLYAAIISPIRSHHITYTQPSYHLYGAVSVHDIRSRHITHTEPFVHDVHDVHDVHAVSWCPPPVVSDQKGFRYAISVPSFFLPWAERESEGGKGKRGTGEGGVLGPPSNLLPPRFPDSILVRDSTIFSREDFSPTGRILFFSVNV